MAGVSMQPIRTLDNGNVLVKETTSTNKGRFYECPENKSDEFITKQGKRNKTNDTIQKGLSYGVGIMTGILTYAKASSLKLPKALGMAAVATVAARAFDRKTDDMTADMTAKNYGARLIKEDEINELVESKYEGKS